MVGSSQQFLCELRHISVIGILVHEFDRSPANTAFPVNIVLCPFEWFLQFDIAGHGKEDTDPDRCVGMDYRIPGPGSGSKDNENESDESDRFLVNGYHLGPVDGPGNLA